MAALVGVGIAGAPGSPAWAATTPQSAVVSAVPSAATPNAVDGAVYAITQVGDTVLMGGSFTQVQPPNRSTTYDLPYVIAFDATTGAVNTAFAPQLDGAVNALLPGPTAGTVYVGGAFGTMAGVRSKGLVLLDVSNGNRVAGFTTPTTNGIVQTVRRSGGRLFVGGTFTTYGGAARGGLATVDATTGALDSFLTSTVTVNHNWTATNGGAKGAVQVSKLDITPDGRRMVAIGNFTKVDGLDRDQVAMWDLTGATAVLRTDWATHRYEPACYYWAYDSYVRDLDISPDGTYFVIAATGGGNGTLCDTTSRWEIAAGGPDVQPTWAAYAGGDTFLSVAATGTAVYAGGHMRWLNNPNGNDSPGGGAVPRPGLAALDPATGMPLAWNPGRNPRGAGASALFASSTGLWVGSDTNYIGDRRYARWKIAFFPLAGGAAPASTAVQALPGGVYLGDSAQAAAGGLTERNFDGSTAGAATGVTSPLDFSTVRGATLVGGTLFYGRTDGLFYQRSFGGGGFGPERLIDPYDDPAWVDVDTGSGQTYRGTRPSFYAEIPSITSLFTDGTGQLYYTLSGQGALYRRSFSADSGTVHDDRFATGATLPDITGAFATGGNLYYATRADGNLTRVGFSAGTLTGTATVVSGPATDGIDWRSTALFLGPRIPADAAPTAVAAVTCSGLACSASSAGSSDADGSIASSAWTWGDGTGSTGATASHTYGTAGTYTVTLIVTDDAGATGTATRSVTVAPPAAAPIAFRAAAGSSANTTAARVTVPAAVRAGDGLVLVATVNSDTPTLGGPVGWTEVASDTTSGIVSRVWSRVATAADAGAVVTVTSSTTAKVDLRLAAYSGTSATGPVRSLAGAVDTATTATHATPAATVVGTGSWVLSYWADKSASTTAWTVPAGSAVRTAGTGTGSAHITAVLTDGGAPAPAGAAGGLTATTDAAGNKATILTIVLARAS